MREIPILFSTPMVQAILAGQKTMTRREVSQRNSYCTSLLSELDFNDVVEEKTIIPNYGYIKAARHSDDTRHRVYCRYEVGDVLWVRETFNSYNKSVYGMPDEEVYLYKANGTDRTCKWKPNLFMPKAACRIWLEVISIKCERVQDISEEDAIAEGVDFDSSIVDGRSYVNYLIKHPSDKMYCELETAKLSFQSLWKSINGNESWDANNWCWAISFKRIKK